LLKRIRAYVNVRVVKALDTGLLTDIRRIPADWGQHHAFDRLEQRECRAGRKQALEAADRWKPPIEGTSKRRMG
jgi:hypothetical protein